MASCATLAASDAALAAALASDPRTSHLVTAWPAAGVRDAQSQALSSVYGVGTDLTVTGAQTQPAEGGGGPRFDFGAEDGSTEDGTTSLDEPVGQEGCTVRHLLSHAGGYSFDGVNPITSPERKRIYSNTGIEILAEHVADRAGMSFADYLREAVCTPLGLSSTSLEGSAAKDVVSNVSDCAKFAAELRRPTVLAKETVRSMATVHFPASRRSCSGPRTF